MAVEILRPLTIFFAIVTCSANNSLHLINMNNALSFTSAVIIGLVGAVHCLGMCGGIIGALSQMPQLPSRKLGARLSVLLLYNAGRIFSYTLAGIVVGLFGMGLEKSLADIAPILRIFAGAMMLAMGLYISGWWSGLRLLENLGNRLLWKRLLPLGKGLTPLRHVWQALLLGMLWGWLPCGLVYSTLSLALVWADWQQSALIMLGFGLGTLPAMLLSGSVAQQFKPKLQQTSTRRLAAVVVIGFGLWTMAMPLIHLTATH